MAGPRQSITLVKLLKILVEGFYFFFNASVA